MLREVLSAHAQKSRYNPRNGSGKNPDVDYATFKCAALDSKNVPSAAKEEPSLIIVRRFDARQ